MAFSSRDADFYRTYLVNGRIPLYEVADDPLRIQVPALFGGFGALRQ